MNTKERARLYVRKYRRSKWGLVGQIYQHQRQLCRKRKHPFPTYSHKQLYEWCIAQPVFHRLHKDWIASGYNMWFVPSVDRKDATGFYVLNNLQLMTFKENNIKGRSENVETRLDALRQSQIKSRKKIKQFTLDGKFLKEYESATYAARILGFCQQNINNAIIGRQKTAGGYKWKYA